MRRFFISQHPTFGSFANPISSLIEKSPYYFWWLALTLNKYYLSFCENPKILFILDSSNKNTDIYNINEIEKVYKDFGDVRYVGCKYQAFTKWWNKK